MKTRQNSLITVLSLSAVILFHSKASADSLFWKTSTLPAAAWTSSSWAIAAGGPYDQPYITNSGVVFEANGGTALSITGATIRFASITANEDVNFTPGGTVGTNGTVAPITVADGKTLTFGGQGVSSAAGTGFIKKGKGTWSLTGDPYPGGLTIEKGTVATNGVNALGNGALTIADDGLSGEIAIRSTAVTTRNFSGKLTSITIQRDFTLGSTVSSNNGGLIFNAPTSLGSVTRTLTVHNATNFDGVISGDSSAGIVKSGLGTLLLGASNTYTGNTTVNEGTLSLSQPSIADTSALEIASGAVLNLTHSAIDTVASLKINGSLQAPGTYNAANTSGRITGTGSILVAGSDPFTTWLSTHPTLTGLDATKGADPDNDGMTNFQEFAFDGDPTSSAASGKIRTRVETIGAEQALVITAPVRSTGTPAFSGNPKSLTIDGIKYTIEGSNDLVSFNQEVTQIPPSSIAMPALSNAAWSYRSFRLDGAIPARGEKGFLRMAVETP
jgi:autotransporter-associated beta strand protein